jgi:hypothetical protein
MPTVKRRRKHNSKRKRTKKNRQRSRNTKGKVISDVSKDKKGDDENEKNKSLDEKGNPFPIENPEGGDPICEGGYKIDYQFDPINDPINPPFRCIPALKEDGDGGTINKLLKMANNPSSGVKDVVLGV